MEIQSVKRHEMELSQKQLSTLRHMLGINDRTLNEPKVSRNYAAVQPGDPEFSELAALGMVVLIEPSGAGPFKDYDFYRCTRRGISVAIRSFPDIQLPRPSRRYRAYLRVRDVFPDLDFKTFLTHDQFREARRV